MYVGNVLLSRIEIATILGTLVCSHIGEQYTEAVGMVMYHKYIRVEHYVQTEQKSAAFTFAICY